MQVEIWSDVLCPWCAIGRARFAEALREYPHRDGVEVAWRSFQLDVHAPEDRGIGLAEHLATKYGVSAERAEAMMAQVAAAGDQAGLDLRLDRARPSNSFRAHQLLHLAREEGGHVREDVVKDLLFAAYLTEGEVIADPAVLERIAVDAGLDAATVRAALADGRHGPAVRAEQALAAQFGISSVPAYVIDRTFLVPGAQPPETMCSILDEARLRFALQPVPAAGESCDDGSCTV